MISTADELDLAELEELRIAHDQIRQQMSRQIVGQDEVVEQLLMAVFARGHCILEGVPGLAKALMVHSLAQSLSRGTMVAQRWDAHSPLYAASSPFGFRPRVATS